MRETLRRAAEGPGAVLVGRPGAAVCVLALAAFGGLGGVALLLPESRLVAAFHDDAFYYLGVARNVAAGKGCTFDGIHATNGFHPLWLGTLVPVFALLRDDATVVRAVLAIQIVLSVLGAFVSLRALLPRLGAGAATAALAIVTLPGAGAILSSGLESSLALALLAITWSAFDRAAGREDASPAEWLALGGLCAAAFLARFEALVLTPTCLVLGYRRLRRNPGSAAALLAPPAATAIAFVIWNRVWFGTWLPISGLIKSTWAARATPLHRLEGLLEFPWFGSDLLDGRLGRAGVVPGTSVHVLAHLVLLGGILALGWWYRRTLVAAVRSSRAAALLGACAAWVALDKAAGLHIEPWNRVPIHLSTAVLIGALVSSRRRLVVVCNLLLLAFAMVQIPRTALALGRSGSTYATYRYRAAAWLRRETPEGTRIGSWNAGLLGFASHRTVVNLDGLVNDRRYFEEVILAGDLDGYLRREGIERLADQTCGIDPSLRPYLGRTGSERLEPEFSLEQVFADDRAPDRCPGYAVWLRKVSEDRAAPRRGARCCRRVRPGRRRSGSRAGRP